MSKNIHKAGDVDWPTYARWKGSALFLLIQLAPSCKIESDHYTICNGRLKVRIPERPINGSANEGLCRCMAKALHFPKSFFKVTKGLRSKEKILSITCTPLQSQQFLARIAEKIISKDC